MAETFEVARDAAARVKVTYEAAPFATRIKAKAQEAYAPKTVRDLFETDTSKGDFAAAFAGAAVQLDATYETPIQHHNAIEPNSSMAVWDGDVMTVYSASQLAMDSREVLASTLKLPRTRCG